jgi:hypothetical protein
MKPVTLENAVNLHVIFLSHGFLTCRHSESKLITNDRCRVQVILLSPLVCGYYPRFCLYQLQLVCRFFFTPVYFGSTLHWLYTSLISPVVSVHPHMGQFGQFFSQANKNDIERSTKSQIACVLFVYLQSNVCPILLGEFAWTPTIHQSVYHNLSV